MPSVPPHTTTSTSAGPASRSRVVRTNCGGRPHTLRVRTARHAASARFRASYEVVPPAPSTAQEVHGYYYDCAVVAAGRYVSVQGEVHSLELVAVTMPSKPQQGCVVMAKLRGHGKTNGNQPCAPAALFCSIWRNMRSVKLPPAAGAVVAASAAGAAGAGGGTAVKVSLPPSAGPARVANRAVRHRNAPTAAMRLKGAAAGQRASGSAARWPPARLGAALMLPMAFYRP